MVCAFLRTQVVHSFRHITLEKINEFWNNDLVARTVLEFLDNPESQAVFIKEGKGSLELIESPTNVGKAHLFYVVKLNKTQVSEENISREIIYGEVAANPLEHMASLAQRVFQPVVGRRHTAEVWSEVVAKDVRDHFDTFVSNVQITQGHVEGTTCLPLPNSGGAKSNILDEAGGAEEDQDRFRQIHALESALITWTKQIKNVLKQDPESLFEVHSNPGPLQEIEFWKIKAQNLNSIFNQLQSVRVRRVLKVLDQAKSTYNAPFAKLCKEVFHARSEANNIIKYLRPLVPWFEALENELQFENLVDHFTPIIHTVLLVWKSSAYYNTSARLVILMREISNTLIRQACLFLNGDAIFELVEAGETQTAVKMLKTALNVFGRFKTIYLEYKARTLKECPENPWTVQNNAVFVRLDSFLERCHDILDFAQTIMMFSKLAKIEVGGTKGKTLTTSVAQIYSDFNQAVEAIRLVGKGILDLENKQFEDAFYEFRTRMKELDRRLGSVILQGFEDASTVAGRFRLLDSFDNLITRPIVADALEKKHSSLIEAIRVDLLAVQNLFNDYKDAPLIASNLPPIAGALTWSRSLRDRIQLPITKLKTLDKKILEREDTREVIKLFTSLYGQLSDLDKENIEAWGASIESSSQAKLKNPLLRRDAVEGSQHSLLFVNFDPILVKLLREVKYFLLLGLEVPATAMEIYQRVEVFRRHTGNLDLIVNMYNDIQTTLLPVERPLVKAQLDRIDKTLSQGVGEGKLKAKSLNWKSNGIDLFIGETMTEVKEVSEMLQMLKGNLKSVEQSVSIWQTLPIFERGYKTVQTAEFINLQKKVRQTKLQAVKEAGQEIHRLLKDTNKKLKVSQGLPDWKAYVDFTNNVVVYGLIDAMAASVRAMAAQFNPAYLEANNLPALLEIQLDLRDKKVTFTPEVGLVEFDGRDTASRDVETGIQNIVAGWINGMLGLASAFKRLDTSEGTYLREISESPEVCAQRAKVMRFLKDMETLANKLRNQFRKYEYLWLTDIHKLFDQFVSEVVAIENVPFVPINNEATEASAAAAAAAAAMGAAVEEEDHGYWQKTNINLEKFGEKIKNYAEIETEVSEIKTIHEINFIKVNVQPIKRAISTWVTKWLYMHTQFLQDYVGERLADLNSFLQTVNAGLDMTVESGNREALMTVMKHVHNVRKRMPEISALFDPMDNTVALLKSHGIAIDLPPIGEQAALDFLEQSKMLWDNTVNKAFRVKAMIQPLQSSMLEGIRKEVKLFNTNVLKFVKEFRQNGPFNWPEAYQTRNAYLNLDNCQQQLVDLERAAKSVNDLEDLFELPLSTHSSIREIGQDLRLLKTVWDTVVLVESLFAMWRNTLWAEIDTEVLLEEVKKLQNQLKKHTKKPREWAVFKRLEVEVKNMAICLPLVHDLHSPAMRERHWKSLMQLTGQTFDRGATFCLDDLLNLNLQYHVDAVSEIVEVANKELKIENKLATIEDIWRKFSLRFDQHRDTEVFVVAPPDDVLEALEEHSLVLQSMAGMGKFVEFFREQVSHWQQSLGEVESTLKLVLLVERQWGSLESIFLGSADIRAQLPDDTKRFEAVDAEFKEQMRDIQSKPGVLDCCRADGREQALVNMHRELEKCEKALNEYLEIKKGFFPRFYFVSNAALLDILSNGNCPAKIMPHIGSVFDGIGDLELCYTAAQAKVIKDEPESNPGAMEGARAMVSKDRETVAFPWIFEMKGAVESWLNDLVKNMQMTLKGVLAVSMTDALAWEDINKPREEWVFNVPAQIALVTSQVIWTEEVEAALEELESGQEDALKKYNELCNARLESLIRLVQMELSKGDRVKIITVITIDVHNRDVVGALVAKKVETNVDFKWQSQLRYYWLPDDRNVNIRICDFATSYSFEYVGNCGRLVITPLTDRCYVTLTVALRLFLGGAPAGPAGTGKTETTKVCSLFIALSCSVLI
jgi:dynein heavy chain